MEFSQKCVRGHGIEIFEIRCHVLKCEGIKGVFLKYAKFLDWTMLKACLKDQKLLLCIDMKLCDNVERYY